MTKKREQFTSRWGLILSMIGVAIGAGNIWRFSRIVAQNGGGSFLIPWLVFLFIWSIPLIFAEIGIGKLTRKAPIGAMAKMAGPSFGWMGAFIALVTTGILFYYSVVVGWGASYFVYSLNGSVTGTMDHGAFWEGYIHSYSPLIFHVISVIAGSIVIYKGIANGIEKTNKILIPTLLVFILIIAIRAVTLPGAWEGIRFFLTPNLKDLFNHKIWLEALTQNAWDTGAGWGLLLVYAGYTKAKGSVTVNGCITAFANNAISLVMGITIFSAAFALESTGGVHSLMFGEASSNTGLTFIYLPKIFQQLPGGSTVHILFSSIFFLAFTFAALSSLISMLQLTMQVFNELGMRRNHAIILTSSLALLLGAPSAISMAIFENQDWVWSIGLIMNGLFIAFAVIRYGVNRFRVEVVNAKESELSMNRFFNFVIGILVPLQAIILVGWFFYQGFTESVDWWNPLQVYGVATVVVQWGIGLIVVISLNKWLTKRSLTERAK